MRVRVIAGIVFVFLTKTCDFVELSKLANFITFLKTESKRYYLKLEKYTSSRNISTPGEETLVRQKQGHN